MKRLEHVDLLLVSMSHQVVVGLPGDGQDRGAVQLGVVEAVQQVDRPGPAGGDADAEPPGELGVAAGGERGPLFVPALDEPDLLSVLPQRLEEPVDAVAGQAEAVSTPQSISFSTITSPVVFAIGCAPCPGGLSYSETADRPHRRAGGEPPIKCSKIQAKLLGWRYI